MNQFLRPLPLAALALLTACDTVVDVKPPDHTPRLALAYTLSTQAPTPGYRQFFAARDLYVSTSQGALASAPLAGRTDATVELRDASGQVVEQFRPRARPGYPDSLRGYYVPLLGYRGQPGQRYTLRASAPGVEAAEATITLPAPATLTAGSYVPKAPPAGSPPNLYNFQGQLSFAILDDAATTDYYLAYARVLDAAGRYWGFAQQDYQARNNDGPEIKLTRFDLSQPGSFYRLLPLSDVGRNGQRIAFSNDISLYYDGRNAQGPLPAPAFLEVIVSSVPAATADFYQSVQRYSDTDGNPFAEPAPLRSNVAGGYGLFAGATETVLRIPL